MNLQLEGLTAVVTGGTGGIGGAIVKALAAEGCVQSTVQGTELMIPYLRKSSHGAITYIGSLGSSLAMPTS